MAERPFGFKRRERIHHIGRVALGPSQRTIAPMNRRRFLVGLAGGGEGDWDTGMLTGGETATVTFNRPGTYNYTCTPHPFMIGQIVVTGEAVASAPAIVVDSPAPKKAGAPNSAEHSAH